FQSTQPGARCFGSFAIRPLRTTEGNPIETASYFQPWEFFLICDTNSFGDNFIPESNLRVSVREIISFTWVPPMSTTRILFFIATLARASYSPNPNFWKNPRFSGFPVVAAGGQHSTDRKSTRLNSSH